MEAYTDFAYLYDKFMEDVPYDKWAIFLNSLIKAYNENAKSLVDLGCGTGTLAMLMAKDGYEVTGVDISEDMLAVASNKAINEDQDIMFIRQDMCELELLDMVDIIYSFCDSINYLITDEDVLNCFNAVKNNLNKDGLFIFDFNTVYKYETVIGDTTIAENREDCSFIWENFYSTEDQINEYDVTFFVSEDENNELFRRFTETHIQRGYEFEDMKKFIEKSGLKFIAAFDEETKKEPTQISERIYIVARK